MDLSSLAHYPLEAVDTSYMYYTDLSTLAHLPLEAVAERINHAVQADTKKLRFIII